MPTLARFDWFSILLKHSTEYTQHSFPERPRRGESMAVAKSRGRFRLAKPSCFRLGAIAGALLVIAPISPAPLVLPSNPNLHHRIYILPCNSCASTAIRCRRAPIMTPPRVGNCLYQQRSARNPPAVFINRTDDTAVSASSVAQPRPAIYKPQT